MKKIFLVISLICVGLTIASQLSPPYATLACSILVLMALPLVKSRDRRFYIYSGISGVVFILAAFSLLHTLLAMVDPVAGRSPKEPPGPRYYLFQIMASYAILIGMSAGCLFGLYLGKVQRRYEDRLSNNQADL